MRIKRVFDLVTSIALLVILLPMMALIAVLVSFFIGGSPLFFQPRAGRFGRIFKMLKFKTMHDDRSREKGFAEVPEAAIPALGRFLRKSGLDELPQLFNVLGGDMSIVGPRPALPYQASAYSSRQARRLLFPPGMTGLAQISGRSSISWEKRIELDIDYITKWTIWKDVLIVFNTPAAVVSSMGSGKGAEAA
jgi:lipopolysaccharide/colanic/teichoic acid biosynthesis glycosyltransferase